MGGTRDRGLKITVTVKQLFGKVPESRRVSDGQNELETKEYVEKEG